MRSLLALAMVACSSPAGAPEATPEETPAVIAASPDEVPKGGDNRQAVSSDAGLDSDVLSTYGGADSGSDTSTIDAPADVATRDAVADVSTTVDAGSDAKADVAAPYALRCGLSGGTVYTMSCTTPFPTSDPSVTKIEWRDGNLAPPAYVYGCYGGGWTCAYGTSCRVWYTNGTYQSGVCQ